MALCLRSWVGNAPGGDAVFRFWVLSWCVLPYAPVAKRLRSRPRLSIGFALLGAVAIALGLAGRHFSPALDVLSPVRTSAQGLMLVFMGGSNWLLSRKRPEVDIGLGSLLCGAAALASGATWVWLAMAQAAAAH